MDDNQRRFESTIRRLDEMIQRHEHQHVATSAKFALTALHERGIKAKLGGSLAAYLLGGTRPPRDVDIELESGSNLDAAHRVLTGEEKFVFEGNRLRLSKDRFSADATAWIQLKFRDEKKKVGLDLVNENRRSFNRNIKSPAMMGSPAVGMSSDWRLVVNCIDRRRKDPDWSRRKEDAEQVYEMLSRGNYNKEKIELEIRSRVQKGSRTNYLETLAVMMEEGRQASDLRFIVGCVERRLRAERLGEPPDTLDAADFHDIMLRDNCDKETIEREIDARIKSEYQPDYLAALKTMLQESATLREEEARRESDWGLIVDHVGNRLRAERRGDPPEKKDAAQVHDTLLLGKYDQAAIDREIDSRIKPAYQAEYKAMLTTMVQESMTMKEEARRASDWDLIVSHVRKRLRAEREHDRIENQDSAQVHDILLLGDYDQSAIEREIDLRIKPQYQAEYNAMLTTMVQESMTLKEAERRENDWRFIVDSIRLRLRAERQGLPPDDQAAADVRELLLSGRYDRETIKREIKVKVSPDAQKTYKAMLKTMLKEPKAQRETMCIIS